MTTLKSILSDLPVFGSKKPQTSYPKGDKVKTQQTSDKGAKKPIRKVSLKRAKENAIYAVERPKFLKERVFCQIKRSECKGKATEVHHQYDGADRQKYFLDQSTWIAACSVCHKWVHNYPQAAKTLGFLK